MSCILPDNAKALQKAIKENGGAKFLRSMTGDQRVDFFAKYVDSDFDTTKPNANLLNRQVETKMLEPAQNAALMEWIREMPQDKRLNTFGRDNDIINKIISNKQILTPKKDGTFLAHLAKQKMGFAVSPEASKELIELATSANQYKKEFFAKYPNYETLKGKELKAVEQSDEFWKFGIALKNLKDGLADITVQSKKAGTSKAERIGYTAIGTLKALKATADISFSFRQNLGVLFSHPKSWLDAEKAALKTWWDTIKTGDGRTAAEIRLLMRPNALNGNYQRFGLQLGMAEEAFEDSIVSKIRVARASDDAFAIAAQTGRANLFDYLFEAANGDLNVLRAAGVGDVVNNTTGRGNLLTDKSKAEKYINAIFFAPRWVASRVRTMADVVYAKHYFENTPSGVRAKASVNTIMSSVLLTAFAASMNKLLGDDEDRDWDEVMGRVFDPRSAEFLQARWGNARFDTSTATGSLVRTTARIITGQTRTADGNVMEKERWSTVGRFLGSKVSPAVQVASYVGGYGSNLLLGTNFTDYNYKPLTELGFVEQVAPIIATNLVSTLFDSTKREDAGAWVSIVADMVGVSSQYWEPSEKNEGKSERMIREQQRLAYSANARVGSSKAASNASINTKLSGRRREQANRDFTSEYTRAADRLIASSAYKRMTDEQKKQALSKLRTETLKKINKKYGLK